MLRISIAVASIRPVVVMVRIGLPRAEVARPNLSHLVLSNKTMYLKVNPSRIVNETSKISLLLLGNHETYE